jgi:AcrR family transcriptional regulator
MAANGEERTWARVDEHFFSDTSVDDMTEHRSHDERADQILNAARDCFLEKGYFATRMDEIARESGLSKGGIYFHFDSKKDIFRTLVEQEYEEAMALLEGAYDSDESEAPTEMFAEVGHLFTERFATTDAPRFMAIIAEMALRDEEIRQMLLELQHNYIERTADVLETGIEQGHVRQEVDPESAAILLKAIIDGIEAGFAIGYDLDIETLVSTAMTILGRGLLEERDLGELAAEEDAAE